MKERGHRGKGKVKYRGQEEDKEKIEKVRIDDYVAR